MYENNAVLSYKTSTNIPTGFDPIIGTPTFEVSETSESFEVSIEQKPTQAQISSMAGDDITGIYCEGRAEALPDWYNFGTTLDVAWNNGDTGKFYVLPTIPSRLGLEAVFGQPIKGVLLT